MAEFNIYWRRKWQSTPVLLPGKSHGQRSLVGYSPLGCKESDMTEWLHFNIYNTSKYIMKKLTKLEEKLEKCIILGYFSAQLSVPYRRYRRQTIWLKNLTYRANVKYYTQQLQKHFLFHIYRNWLYTCSYSKS